MRWSQEEVEQAVAAGSDIEDVPEIVAMANLVEVGMGLMNEVDEGGERVVGLKNSYGTTESHVRGGKL